MAITYQGRFNYDDLDYSGGNFQHEIPVHSFLVRGGAWRTIYLDSADDFLLMSEFEQARLYKNITLFMPSAKNHVVMKAAVQLNEFARNQTTILLTLRVSKYQDGRKIEDLQVGDDSALITTLPSIVAGNLLKIEITLPYAQIFGNFAGSNPNLKGGKHPGPGFSRSRRY